MRCASTPPILPSMSCFRISMLLASESVMMMMMMMLMMMMLMLMMLMMLMMLVMMDPLQKHNVGHVYSSLFITLSD
jgi:hypothetical protein